MVGVVGPWVRSWAGRSVIPWIMVLCCEILGEHLQSSLVVGGGWVCYSSSDVIFCLG